jgi:DUF438 domain-containing protein
MSEFINNTTRRKETLKNVLRQLQEGRSLESVKAEFGGLTQEISSVEIAEIEQLLIEEGTPPEEIQRLCDVHVAFFKDHLDLQKSPETIPGHPLFTLRAENQLAESDLNKLRSRWESFRKDPKLGPQKVVEALEQVMKFEAHYRRKESLLFPFLEKYGFSGPSTVMWGIQDQIRAFWKAFHAQLSDLKAIDWAAADDLHENIQHQMREMFYKEDKVLFPSALERLKEADWVQLRHQEDEIGYYELTPSREWQLQQAAVTPVISVNQSLNTPGSGLLSMQTGALTLEQINLMLTNLPVDVTFVDENDEVRFFSQTQERIFERLPAIIGRKVQNCHPPQSVDKVQRILEDFRAKKRDVAEFWIEMMGMFIHIRYFALRDAHGKYRGTIEVSQNVKAIRELQGERRLLDD